MTEINPNEIEIASGTNDVGLVFHWKNGFFRAIQKEYVEMVKDFFKSGMIDELTENNLFPESWITDYKLEGYGLVIEHAKLDPVSYPYEWSFSMLKDAALIVLKVNIIAKKYHYQTQDCHAYNVIFDGTQPKYVDLGSFQKIDEEYEGWSAHEDFFKSYYYPLKIWSTGDSFFARKSLTDGEFMHLDSYLFYKYPFIRILGFSRVRKLVKYYFDYRKLSSVSSTKIKKIFPGIVGSLIIFIKENNLLILQKVNYEKIMNKIKRISYKRSSTQWGQYQKEFYDDNGKLILTSRFNKIIEIVNDYNIESVVELGGNQGILSRILLKRNDVKHATCIDYDEEAVELMYILSKKEKIPLNSVVQNCIIQIGGTGPKLPWERFKSDAVIALALTHHLILSQNIRIEYILEIMSKYTNKYILIEFMPMGLWDGNYAPPLPEWYTIDWFRKSFEQYFNIIIEEQLEKNRILFFGQKRNELKESFV